MIIDQNKTRERNLLVYALFILLAACASSHISFIESNMEFGAIRTAAIMPFENLSIIKQGEDRVRDVFTNRLLSTGAIYVIPRGEVSRASRIAGVTIPSAPSDEEIIKLGAIAKVDAVFTGVVKEYGKVSSGVATANLVSLSIKLIDAKSGRTIREESSTKGGITIIDRLTGGSGQPLNNVTEEAVNDIINKYVQFFSMKDKEHKKIPSLVLLKKSEDVVKAKDSLDKEQQKAKELKEVEIPRNNIALIDKEVYSPLKDQHKTQELKEAKEKVKESLKKITKPRKEVPLLKERDDTKNIKQNNNAIEASSNEEDKNIIQARPDKKIDNTNKFINKLSVDSKYASKTIYTIQTGSHTKKAVAEKEFNSILKALKNKKYDYLRIEKIGKYYAVRLGRFTDYYTAKQFMAKFSLSKAVILDAYIKQERIIRFNAGSLSVINKTR